MPHNRAALTLPSGRQGVPTKSLFICLNQTENLDLLDAPIKAWNDLFPANLTNKEKYFKSFAVRTFEYIRLSGRLIAIERSHTNAIFSVTRFLVLLRPKRIGYLSDRYLSIDIVHKCMMLAVQNSTSRQIHTRQWIECSGKNPESRE